MPKSTQGLQPLTGKTLKLTVAFCFLAVLGSEAFRLSLQKNRDVPKIEAYIRASDSVHSRLGAINKTSVTGVTSVDPSLTSPGYMIYRVYVQGAAGSEVVNIYVTHPLETAVLTEQTPRDYLPR